jgi:hypothetical protein
MQESSCHRAESIGLVDLAASLDVEKLTSTR